MTEPTIGTRAPSYRSPAGTRLRELTEVLDRIRLETDAPVGEVLIRVASGLTGDLNGYRERALARVWFNAYCELVDTPLDDLKAAERARRIAGLNRVLEAIDDDARLEAEAEQAAQDADVEAGAAFDRDNPRDD